MSRAGAGRIVVMGSAAALRGQKRTSTYSAARGAQLAYVHAVGVEVAPHHVQVNAIAQNFVDNPTYFPPEVQANPALPGAAEARSAARPPGVGARGCAVRGVSVQRRRGLLRRPGVSGLRRLGCLTARARVRSTLRRHRDRLRGSRQAGWQIGPRLAPLTRTTSSIATRSSRSSRPPPPITHPLSASSTMTAVGRAKPSGATPPAG